MSISYRALFLGVVVGLASLALADSPGLIHYQGRLVDGGGLYNGTISASFRLYTNSSPVGDEALLFEDTNILQVADGLYTYFIGENATTGSLASALDPVYLELTINGTALLPRERMASVPYALSATEADPVWAGVSNLYYLKAQPDALYATGAPVYVESDPA